MERGGRKQHCTHSQSQIMGTAGWHQLYRHSRHFTGITWQWTPVSVWPLTAQKDRKKKRWSQRQRRQVKYVFVVLSREECWNKHEGWAEQQVPLHQYATVLRQWLRTPGPTIKHKMVNLLMKHSYFSKEWDSHLTGDALPCICFRVQCRHLTGWRAWVWFSSGPTSRG